jgi:hypothetical protein
LAGFAEGHSARLLLVEDAPSTMHTLKRMSVALVLSTFSCTPSSAEPRNDFFSVRSFFLLGVGASDGLVRRRHIISGLHGVGLRASAVGGMFLGDFFPASS